MSQLKTPLEVEAEKPKVTITVNPFEDDEMGEEEGEQNGTEESSMLEVTEVNTTLEVIIFMLSN